MAAPKLISELTAASSLTTADLIPVYQGGVTKYATLDLLPFAQSGSAVIAETVQEALRNSVVNLFTWIPLTEREGIRDRTTTTDLSTYIQNAINDCNTAGGRRIFAPAGYYPCNNIVLKSQVQIEGEWVGPMNARADGSATATFPAASATKGSVFAQHATTGDVFKTSEFSTVTHGAGLKNLVIIGKSGGTSGRGVYLSQGTFYCSVENCCIARMPDQGVVTGGVANNVEKNFIGFNSYYDVANITFYKGNLEVYGADQFISHNEVHGPLAYTTFDGEALANASLYAVACLAQTASSFFHKNVFEIADAGLVVISRHTGSDGASGKNDPYYPASCHSNSFIQNRADFNLGHGIWLISTDSLNGPYLNNFVGNWVAHCGRNANATYQGIYEDAVGANYPHSNSFVGNTVFNSAGATNEVAYGIHTSEASALQTAAQADVVEANRVDSSSVATAPYSGQPSGTFTPVATFATPGDLSVAYAADGQIGNYTKIGNRIFYDIFVNASTFTHTTASGNFRITGLPFAAKTQTNHLIPGACSMQGWTLANFTNTVAYASGGTSYLEIQATGSAQTRTTLTTAHLPTGTAKVLMISGHYDIA